MRTPCAERVDLYPEGWRDALAVLAAAEHRRRVTVGAECVHLRNGINDCRSVAYGIWKALPQSVADALVAAS